MSTGWLPFHFLKSGNVFNFFFFFLEKLWKTCGAVLTNGTTLVRGTVFFSNIIIKEKWLHFNKVEPFFPIVPLWSHFGSTFFSVNASHLKYIFLVGMRLTFLLHILFLLENGKPIAATSDWDLHSQKEYQFWACICDSPSNKINSLWKEFHKKCPLHCKNFLRIHNRKLL